MKPGSGIGDWRRGEFAGLGRSSPGRQGFRRGSVRNRSGRTPIANVQSRLSGFSLIELLVALAVFATMAALAYGGLDSVARTRAQLSREQAQFHALLRGVGLLERDLRQAAARPVRDNYGQTVPAFAGTPDHIELTRVGFANPQSEPRSNLERVVYAIDGKSLRRGAYAVLDRAPGSTANVMTLRDNVELFRLRYLDGANRWSDTWPPLAAAGTDPGAAAAELPRAVEFRIGTKDAGEISRLVELVSPWPGAAP